MHARKTKILSNINNEQRTGQQHIMVNDQKVDVLPRVALTMYFGWALEFEETNDTGIQRYTIAFIKGGRN